MDTSLLSFVEQTVHDALILEVSTTPKPGLVDCLNSGAHKDMDYHTFVSSTNAIVPYITDMFSVGLFSTDTMPPETLFSQIREIGIKAEKAMFTATNGINTHKGVIFSMGTVALAAGSYYRVNHCFSVSDILSLSGTLSKPAIEQDFIHMKKHNPITHGEILFAQYGYKGIRGEAMEGFPSIKNISYPYLRKHLGIVKDDNAVYINTLFCLMSEVDDSNVLIRTNPEMLRYMQTTARHFLDGGGACHPDAKERLDCMNKDFTEKNISPGGCADLLAVTIFLRKLEQYKKEAV